MYGANGARLRLHFDHAGNIAPDVFQPIAGQASACSAIVELGVIG